MEQAGERPADRRSAWPSTGEGPSSLSFERRVALETAGRQVAGSAAEAVATAFVDAGAGADGDDALQRLPETAEALLCAGLAELVQGGLSVDDAVRVRGLLDALRGHLDLDEVLRITRTVGVDHVVQHMDGAGTACSRAEEARLREATSRVIASLTSAQVGGGTDERQILRRLLSTGVDTR